MCVWYIWCIYPPIYIWYILYIWNILYILYMCIYIYGWIYTQILYILYMWYNLYRAPYAHPAPLLPLILSSHHPQPTAPLQLRFNTTSAPLRLRSLREFHKQQNSQDYELFLTDVFRDICREACFETFVTFFWQVQAAATVRVPRYIYNNRQLSSVT